MIPAQPMTDTTPIVRNIHITNVTATSTKDAGLIVGLPESVITNVVLENVRITAETGLTMANAKGIQLKNVQISAKEGPSFITDNAQAEGLPPATEQQ